jgi:hypothetical protein
MTAVVEPGPGLLIATAKMTQGRALMAGLCVCVALLFAFMAWRARSEPLDALWPWGLLSPFFAVLGILLAFGSSQKSFDAVARTAVVAVGLGPFRVDRRVALPASAVIRVTVRREHSTRGGGHGSTTTRWYDLDVAGLPELGFTAASDRDAARAMAARLSKTLGYTVKDEAEDDGVERTRD